MGAHARWRLHPATSLRRAQHSPGRGLLSALAHAHEPPAEAVPIAWAALVGAAGLDAETAAIYADLVRAGLAPAARAALEEFMSNPSTYEFQSDFAKKYVGIGREEGLEEGRREGREEGLEVLRRVLLHAIEARGLESSPAHRDQIEACRDAARLEFWLEQVFSAQSVDDALA